MAKIEVPREKLTASAKAKKIENKILSDDEISEFRYFVAHEFSESEICKTKTRVYKSYLKNRKRELALISLIVFANIKVYHLDISFLAIVNV
jgi:hypothetical protein